MDYTSGRRWAGRHPAASFFVLTYALSWGLWLPIMLGYDGVLREAFFVAGIFGPALAAVLLTRLGGGSTRTWLREIVRWRIRPRWWLVALVVPAFLIGTASAAYALLGNTVDVSLLPGRLGGYLPALALTALIGGGQEEFGWRGFALPRLEAVAGAAYETLSITMTLTLVAVVTVLVAATRGRLGYPVGSQAGSAADRDMNVGVRHVQPEPA